MLRIIVAVTLCALFVSALLIYSRYDSSARSSFANSVRVGDFYVGYPDGWSAGTDANITRLINVAPDKSATLDAVTLDRTAQIQITIEQRTDHADAVNRLSEIAKETSDPVRSLTIGGWPAIQRRHVGLREQPGISSPLPTRTLLTITTAIAAGNQLALLEGRMPADAPSTIADTVAAIETSVSPVKGSSLGQSIRKIARLGATRPGSLARLALWHVDEAVAVYTRNIGKLAARFRSQLGLASAEAKDNLEEPDSTPLVSTPASSSETPSEAGASRIILGGTASEPEVAVSTDGRNVVVAQQFVWTTSNDGGVTFPFFGSFPNSTGGDSSLAFGKSGNFYEGTIFNNSTAIHISTNNGQTFVFRAAAFTCPTAGPNVCPAGFPDQEHIGADRFNTTASGDQVYSAWRQLNGTYGIVCSTNSATSWGPPSFTSGDLPRITVGQDGFVYVIYQSGANIMLNKYAACSVNPKMNAQPGFPVAVALGVNFVNCAVPGLDRCNNGNNLSSFTVAVDDTNASHIYAAYAVNTAFNPTNGTGNENILVRDSTNGGATWRSPVTVNSGATGRRFMPWVCATQSTACVSWYDRRNATTADNDLTDYFGGRAALDVSNNLVAGAEFEINDPATSDAECEAGKPVGSPASWPCGRRSPGDSQTCSRQPQLAGPGSGCPKYGDYNGNACAAGRFYTVWASATPARPTNPNAAAIDLFFNATDCVPLANFKCYEADSEHRVNKTVKLKDQFGLEPRVVVGEPNIFCNPADKDGGGIADATAHLACYSIHTDDEQSRTVVVKNQFGTDTLTLGDSQLLCVPSEKNGVRSTLNLDHFKCYEAESDKAVSKNVNLTDQFGAEKVLVGKPGLFCDSVDKNDGGIKNPTANLTCYKIDTEDTDEQSRTVVVKNQFGAGNLTVGDSQLLCVPGT
jgi:hypothetical protein